jgi:capsular exopolysaccharide synthesis family protein
MSQVYRALEKAEKEKRRKLPEDPLSSIFEEEPIRPKEVRPAKNLNLRPAKVEIPLPENEEILIAPRHSFGEEQFRKLKTYIFRRSPQPPCTILITSSGPGEGKTTVSINLALAISQEIQKKVILVDADLRKPSIFPEKYMNSKGLSDYLSGQYSTEEIISNFERENFLIIPAGTPSEKPAELIGSRKMKELLKNLRKDCDDTFVLIDSPPVLSTAEPLLLSELVDGVILVVMAGKFPKAAVRRVVESIGREKMIGVVFNQKEMRAGKHYYDRYYRYYRKDTR